MSSAREVAAAVRSGERPARQVTEEALAAVAGRDGEVHAFVEVLADEALAQADAVDAAIARGQNPGPLAGVPVALKDNLCTRGIPTTCGSKILEGWRPPYDATVVELAARRRGDCAGQDQHGRVRHGQLDGELRLRAHPQPALHRASAGWQQRWFRRRGRRRVRPARAGIRHRGIDPATGRALRCRGHEAHVRPRLAVWTGGLRQLPRPDRALRPQRRGRSSLVRRPGSPRPADTTSLRHEAPPTLDAVERWSGRSAGRGLSRPH